MTNVLIRDPLTGAYTRAWFGEQLRIEVDRVRRYGQACSLLVFDIDHFKSVNDAFGHARGDDVLVEVVQRALHKTRESDLFFRYGGDEFVLLLPNTTKPEAERLAQRLQTAIQSQPFAGPAPLTLSLSIGVASFPVDAADEQALFQKADARSSYEEALRWSRQLGTRWLIADISRTVAHVLCVEGEYAQAESLYRESLALARAAGDQLGEANSAQALGALNIHLGEYPRAATLLADSLAVYRRWSYPLGIARCLRGLADLHRSEGHAELAARLFGFIEAWMQAHQLSWVLIDLVYYERSIAALQAQVAEPEFSDAWAAWRTMSLEQVTSVVLSG